MTGHPDGDGKGSATAAEVTGRTYELTHVTTYTYSDLVTGSYGVAVLTPRELPDQACRDSVVEVSPAPDDLHERTDFYGNRSTYFEVFTDHRRLEVTARSRVTVTRPTPTIGDLPGVSWQEVAAMVAEAGMAGSPADVSLIDFALPSQHTTPAAVVAEYATESFPAGGSLAQAAWDLTRRIHEDFTYKSGSTKIGTTLPELLTRRRGVCQDFAHLAVGCLRAMGLSARYVSGYLETAPPPGRPKLRGADASHAWAEVWIPGAGWVGIDPTNGGLVGDSYVIVGWGRDYADVPPLKGTIFTESEWSRLKVAVDLIPV
jgi:transglutaminase-like putative cysteine protease